MEGRNDFERLSQSSQSALRLARAHRLITAARRRAPTEEPGQGNPSAITSVDLLCGILASHRENSEPSQLLDYFGIPVTDLYAELDLDIEELEKAPVEADQDFDWDSDAEKILYQSFELADKFNYAEKGLVHLRFLFGGLILQGNPASRIIQTRLSAAGAPFKEVQSTYYRFLEQPVESGGYYEFLTRAIPWKSRLCGFNTDTGADTDLVGIDAEVDAFAYLIANKDVNPPLAIALFGDWGSGKSFFINSVKKRINKITREARQSGRPQRDIAVYKSLAQIEFNAWHYVEGDLWASLVEHIFQNLKIEDEDDLVPGLLYQRRQYWIDKLHQYHKMQEENNARKKELERKKEEKQSEIESLNRDLENQRQLIKAQMEIDVAREKVTLSSQELEQLIRDFNLAVRDQTIGELDTALSELHSELEKDNPLVALLRKGGRRWTAGFTLVLLAGPLLSIMLSLLWPDLISGVTNAVSSVSVFLVGLTALVKNGTAWLSRQRERVDRLIREVDAERLKAAAVCAANLSNLQNEYRKTEQKISEACLNEKTIQADIDRIEAEIQQITPGRVLQEFIEERAGSDDYRRRLGIAALIRRDFEQLSGIIDEANRKFIQDDQGRETSPDKHRINRIVLYIDDLDRCPPERVVQVLQAIHLLLAFRLFVVVVAVDSRWLARSLEKQYSGLLGISHRESPAEMLSSAARLASSRDYLEKIFQIPFWIRPLTEEARLKMVQELYKTGRPVAITGTTNGTEKGSKTKKFERTRLPDDGSRRTTEDTVTIPVIPLDINKRVELNPHYLQPEDQELKFMAGIRPLIGRTPRSVKRYVNIYRLIKAMTMAGSSRFTAEGPTAGYKTVLLLLAVLTGLPHIAPDFLRLVKADQSREPPVRGRDRDSLGKAVTRLRQELEEDSRQPAEGSDRVRVESGVRSATARRELEQLHNWLLSPGNKAWLNLPVDEMAVWVPDVLRFSFYIEQF